MEWKRHTADVEFLGTFPGRLPEAVLPEVAFVGRSNVGKSSAINALLNRKKAARVSGTPGRTQAVNLFRVSSVICLADLPGYGFAKAPDGARRAWGRLVRRYLLTREALALVVCLVDARHPAQKVDIEMLDLLSEDRDASSSAAEIRSVSERQVAARGRNLLAHDPRPLTAPPYRARFLR